MHRSTRHATGRYQRRGGTVETALAIIVALLVGLGGGFWAARRGREGFLHSDLDPRTESCRFGGSEVAAPSSGVFMLCSEVLFGFGNGTSTGRGGDSLRSSGRTVESKDGAVYLR